MKVGQLLSSRVDLLPSGPPMRGFSATSRFRVWGLGFGVQGLGLWGLGFRVWQCPDS